MMTGLFDPARHEPLQAAPWDEAAARETIRRIADSALAAYEPGLGWRAHPLDEPAPPIDRFYNLYFGAGGVIWALRHLAQAGAIGCLPDFTPFVATLREANRPLLADIRHGTASYLFGDAGLDLLHWTLRPDEALAQRLFDTVQGNLHNPVREALWGNPGTVLAAIHMAEATGEARWTALVREAADALHAEMEIDADTGTWLWVQNLYGRPSVRYIGAGHGFAGNVYPFLRGGGAAAGGTGGARRRARVGDAAGDRPHADGGANWFPGINPQRPADWLPPVQDCHGAPGIVCRLATAPRTPEWDTLLLQAGALTWHAGPLSKGAGVCHGTAGSGFAMLKLWRRTGDPSGSNAPARWRCTAMGRSSGIGPNYGQGRHSLWTGDLGLACLLWNCVSSSDAFPTLDVF